MKGDTTEAVESRTTFKSNEGVFEGKRPKNGEVVLKEDGTILGKAVYYSKPGIFGKLGEPEVEYEPPTKKRLYILSEVVKRGMVQYLKANHVEVCWLSDDTNELMDTIIMETEPARLVIIDYGRGAFLSNETVEEVIGLIEAFSDIGEISVFTNTRSFKTALLSWFNKRKAVLKKLDINPFNGAVHLYETLRDKNEIFEDGGAVDIAPENVMQFKGEPLDLTDSEKKFYEKMSVTPIEFDDFAKLITDAEEEEAKKSDEELGLPSF